LLRNGTESILGHWPSPWLANARQNHPRCRHAGSRRRHSRSLPGPAGRRAGSGYGKQYSYDPRLATLTPLSFLPPALFSWWEDTWSKVGGQIKLVTANTESVPSGGSPTTPIAPTHTVTHRVDDDGRAGNSPNGPEDHLVGTTSTNTTTTTTTVPTTTTTTAPTTTTTTAPTTTTTKAIAPSFPASEQTVDSENWSYVQGLPKASYTWNGSARVTTGSSSFTVTASGTATPTVTGTSSSPTLITVTSGGSGAATATVTRDVRDQRVWPTWVRRYFHRLKWHTPQRDIDVHGQYAQFRFGGAVLLPN
jgi:hypothetical protein